MSEGLRERVFCPKCGDYVKPRVERSITPTGELVIEYHCPVHGLLETEKRRVFGDNKSRVDGGLYVALEGIDGSGKTTQAAMLYEKLSAEGFQVVIVREPWVPAIKEFLYKHDLDVEAEVYLFAADRIILQREVVLPSLRAGKIVVSDRSVFASLAYQSSRGADQDFILAVNKSVRFPDVVVLLDLPVEEAMKRLSSRVAQTRFEDPGYMEKVRAKYLRLAEEYPEKFIVVDASKPPEEVNREILREIVSIVRSRIRSEPGER